MIYLLPCFTDLRSRGRAQTPRQGHWTGLGALRTRPDRSGQRLREKGRDRGPFTKQSMSAPQRKPQGAGGPSAGGATEGNRRGAVSQGRQSVGKGGQRFVEKVGEMFGKEHNQGGHHCGLRLEVVFFSSSCRLLCLLWGPQIDSLALTRPRPCPRLGHFAHRYKKKDHIAPLTSSQTGIERQESEK